MTFLDFMKSVVTGLDHLRYQEMIERWCREQRGLDVRALDVHAQACAAALSIPVDVARNGLTVAWARDMVDVARTRAQERHSP